MAKSKISLTFNDYRKKSGVKDVRLSEGATTQDMERAINDAIRGFRKEFDELINTYNREVIYKANQLKTSIERTQQASTTQLITNINSGIVGGGSSTTGSTDVRVQEVAVVSGVATTITFEQPSERLTVPEVWYDEGGERWRTGYAIDDTNLPVSFSITPQASGFCTVSYKFL